MWCRGGLGWPCRCLGIYRRLDAGLIIALLRHDSTDYCWVLLQCLVLATSRQGFDSGDVLLVGLR